jgi:hypothetical protein
MPSAVLATSANGLQLTCAHVCSSSPPSAFFAGAAGPHTHHWQATQCVRSSRAALCRRTVLRGAPPFTATPTGGGRRAWEAAAQYVWRPARRKASLCALSATCQNTGVPEGGLEHFLSLYAGVFDNAAQAGRERGIIRSRKLHKRVFLPQLGPLVFFVKEQTDRGQGWDYRIRIAVISEAAEREGYEARHLQFSDPTCFERSTDPTDEELSAVLAAVNNTNGRQVIKKKVSGNGSHTERTLSVVLAAFDMAGR